MKIINVFKSNFFLKLFLIPSLIFTLLSLLLMTINNSFYDSSDIIFLFFCNLIVILLWFIISMIIYGLNESFGKKKTTLDDNKEKNSTFKKIRFPFIMSIVTFIIGLFISLNLVQVPIKVRIITLFISYLPVFLFLIIIFSIYKCKDDKKIFFKFKFITLIISLFLIVYYHYSFTFISLKATFNAVNNPKYYTYYVTGERLRSVFPSLIPSDVTNVEFYYSPIFLQGGTKYSLYYIDKMMTMDKFDNKYKDKAIWIGHIKDYTKNKGLIPYFFIHTPSYYKNEDDYLIYLIEGNCKGTSYCSHGDILLAAFNDKTHEVVFRSQQW